MNIPNSLPYRVEVWSRDNLHLMETLAASSHLLIAKAAFRAAIDARPHDVLLLRSLAQVIEEHLPD